MESIQDSTKKITAQGSVISTVEIRDCNKHGRQEHRVLKTPFGGGIAVCLACQQAQENAEQSRARAEATLKVAWMQAKINRRLENAMIAPRFAGKTLDSYEITIDGQRRAVADARWLLDNLDSGTPGLILIGGNGTGKNHLASAVVHEAVTKHGKTALITKVRKLDRAIKEAWKADGKESEALKLFSQPDLLVIDEVGLQRGSETELLHLAEIIDDRYEAMRPTILLGNVTLVELKGLIGERAVDRYRERGRVVVCGWKSYRQMRG